MQCPQSHPAGGRPEPASRGDHVGDAELLRRVARALERLGRRTSTGMRAHGQLALCRKRGWMPDERMRWDCLPPHQSLYTYLPACGLPTSSLGSTYLSDWLGLVGEDEVDGGVVQHVVPQCFAPELQPPTSSPSASSRLDGYPQPVHKEDERHHHYDHHRLISIPHPTESSSIACMSCHHSRAGCRRCGTCGRWAP